MLALALSAGQAQTRTAARSARAVPRTCAWVASPTSTVAPRDLTSTTASEAPSRSIPVTLNPSRISALALRSPFSPRPQTIACPLRRRARNSFQCRAYKATTTPAVTHRRHDRRQVHRHDEHGASALARRRARKAARKQRQRVLQPSAEPTVAADKREHEAGPGDNRQQEPHPASPPRRTSGPEHAKALRPLPHRFRCLLPQVHQSDGSLVRLRPRRHPPTFRAQLRSRLLILPPGHASRKDDHAIGSKSTRHEVRRHARHRHPRTARRDPSSTSLTRAPPKRAARQGPPARRQSSSVTSRQKPIQ